MPLTEPTDAPDVKPWNPITRILLPAALLTLLVTAPPHALDAALAALFFDRAADLWPWRSYAPLEAVHCASKLFPVAILLWALLEAARACREDSAALTRPGSPALRLVYVLCASLISLAAVWYLKRTTGVACPWSTDLFGGAAPLAAPTPSLFARPGNCWPAGAAGTGFALLSLGFAFRDGVRFEVFGRGFRPSAAAGFGLALTVGLVCATARMMQGAHFLSHTAATLLIDWLIASLLYGLFFDRKRLLMRLTDAFRHPVPIRIGIPFLAFWWSFVLCAPFLGSLLGEPDAARFGLAGAVGAALLLLQSALFLPLLFLPGAVFRPILLLLQALGAAALTATVLYGTVFTPDMIRNFLATDAHEAAQYLSAGTALLFSAAFLPGAYVIVRMEALRRSGLPNPTARPLAVAVGALLLGSATLLTVFQPFSATMRTDKTARYRIAPWNVVWSAAMTVEGDASPGRIRMRTIVDPAPRATVTPSLPTLFVVMVGETARSANWELSGYGRKVNPKLSALPDLISFPEVVACGSSTDVSLPCMMSRIGRSDYDRSRILSEETLPQLLQRAGLDVRWIDNQSGCKGVCDGVPTQKPTATSEDCPTGRCFDTVLVDETKRLLDVLDAQDRARTTVLFLHLYGQHGPNYRLGSAASKKRFLPECRTADFRGCSRAEIVNAYDNAVLTTDETVAGVIGLIRRAEAEGRATGAVLFVSDHGESLGEKGLYLHGAPYRFAPKEQISVPMLFWSGKTFEKDFRIRSDAIRRRSAGPALTHEWLYHSVLGLLGVRSDTYRSAFDFGR